MRRFVISFFVVCIVLGFAQISFSSIKVGLDSGHSIKELHKSGGAFNVEVKEGLDIVPKPYYAVGWSRTNLFS